MSNYIDGVLDHLAQDPSMGNEIGPGRHHPRLKKPEIWAPIPPAARLDLAALALVRLGEKIVPDIPSAERTAKTQMREAIALARQVAEGATVPKGIEGISDKEIERYSTRLYEKRYKALVRKGRKAEQPAYIASHATDVAVAYADLISEWAEYEPKLRASITPDGKAGAVEFQKDDVTSDVSVESDKEDSPATSYDFTPGCPSSVENVTVTLTEQTLDKELRHKVIQKALYEHLCREVGDENVRVERRVPSGLVDAAVRHNGDESFYEVKVADDARSCLREALGQVVEYAHWPTANRARELIVVGEAELDADSTVYLRSLRERYHLPLYYRRIDMSRNILEEKS